ncbi:MAG: sarcosine oxidase subunit gamma [Propionibacteriaceae bacterium]
MAEQTTTRTRTPPAVLGYRRSPGHHLTSVMDRASGPAVRLREVPFLTQITIRAASLEAVAAVSGALGVALPSRVGEVARGERGQGHDTEGHDGATGSAIWLSPDEWLAVLGDEAVTGVSGSAVVASLTAALGERRGQIVDVSSNRTTLELSGSKARAVLDKTIELDLHPREFPVGRAVSTQLESVAVICWRTTADTWLLLPRASFTEHVVGWLADGMREFA